MHQYWFIDDNKGSPISGNIGVNEKFTNYNDVAINHNWPKATEISSTTEPGGITDLYAVREGFLWSLEPAIVYDDSIERDEVIYTRTQTYRIGTKSVGVGAFLKTHTLKMCRGYADVIE